MKRLIVLLLMVLPLGAFAQELKIAFVNTQQVISAMPEFLEMDKKTAALNAQYESELKQMQEEYNKKMSNFTAAQDSLTENIKLKKMGELQDLGERIQNFVEVAKQEVGKKQQEMFAPIQQKVQDAIKAVGTENGYTYIITPEILLYTSPNATDATPMVKAKLGLK